MRTTSSKLVARGSKHGQATFVVCVSEAGNAWTFGSHGIDTKDGFWRALALVSRRDMAQVKKKRRLSTCASKTTQSIPQILADASSEGARAVQLAEDYIQTLSRAGIAGTMVVSLMR